MPIKLSSRAGGGQDGTRMMRPTGCQQKRVRKKSGHRFLLCFFLDVFLFISHFSKSKDWQKTSTNGHKKPIGQLPGIQDHCGDTWEEDCHKCLDSFPTTPLYLINYDASHVAVVLPFGASLRFFPSHLVSLWLASRLSGHNHIITATDLRRPRGAHKTRFNCGTLS